MDDDDDYTVGYGKPPRHSRFKKGRSGNPAGTPRPSQSPGQIWCRLLQETVTVTENGRKRLITKHELVLSQLINKAASGNEKNLKLFMEMMTRFPPEAMTMQLDRNDQEFLAAIAARVKELDDEY